MSHDESVGRVTHRRLEGDEGSNLVEYALLVALIILVALSAVRFFAANASSKMSCAASTIEAESGSC